MKKKVLLAFICILFFMGGSDAVSAPVVTMTEEEALIAAFENTGAEAMESTISCWTKLNDEFMDMSRVRSEMKRIVQILELDKSKIVKNIESSEQLNKIVLFGNKSKKTYSIAVESIKSDNGGETYVVIDVSMDKDYGDMKRERDAIAEAIPAKAGTANYSSCIIGTYEGKLSEKMIEEKTLAALRAIDAKKVEGMENDEMLSVSAFSNSVDSYIMSRERRINVQVAVRFSSYDNKTYIWIGTPLIPMEY